jgi:benzodiazapine receptor
MVADENVNQPLRVRPTGWRLWLALVGFVGVCLMVGAIGGLLTASSVDTWYRTLAKPSFTPPDALFGPVWTALYVIMGIAAWRIWQVAGFYNGRVALRLFGTQLLLNLLWTFLFFLLQSPAAAFLEILLLIASIVATIVAFRQHDKWAELAMVPYLMWVLFAAVLNGAIWYLN